MIILTRLALSRKSVTIMVMALLLVAGVFSYGRLQRELFPDISLGLVHVITYHQQSDPLATGQEKRVKTIGATEWHR